MPIGEAEGFAFIVMELVAGQTLAAWLDETPRSAADILAAFVAAGRGLAAAHAAGMVHRDFKPDNVMVGNDSRVRVMDFGLVRHADPIGEATAPLTESGMVVGTPYYMSPEQLLGGRADARADGLALGRAVLFAATAADQRLVVCGRRVLLSQRSTAQRSAAQPFYTMQPTFRRVC